MAMNKPSKKFPKTVLLQFLNWKDYNFEFKRVELLVLNTLNIWVFYVKKKLNVRLLRPASIEKKPNICLLLTACNISPKVQ